MCPGVAGGTCAVGESEVGEVAGSVGEAGVAGGTFSVGESEVGEVASFILSLNEHNESRGTPRPIRVNVFSKAVEIFMHAQSVDPQLAFGCDQCPSSLQTGQREEDFPAVIEGHIV